MVDLTHEDDATVATMTCDGATKMGNPGWGGCGAVLHVKRSSADGRESDRTFSAKLALGSRCTNNEAEYQGLLLGLRLAAKHGVTQLRAAMDSQLVANQMTRAGKPWRANLRMRELRDQANELCAQNAIDLDVSQIPRTRNTAADRLAKAAALDNFKPMANKQNINLQRQANGGGGGGGRRKRKSQSQTLTITVDQGEQRTVRQRMA